MADPNFMFCHSCGFNLANDWNHCPKCGAQKGNYESSVQIKDAVLMGDLNITKKEDISAAVKSTHECTSCGSMGAIQKACQHCRKMLYCEVCEDDFIHAVRKNFWDKPKYSNDFRFKGWNGKNRHWREDPKSFEETGYGDGLQGIPSRSCFECLDKTIIPSMSRKCWGCGLYCRGKISIELVENNVKNKYEYFTCQKCFVAPDWDDANWPGGRMTVMKRKFSRWHDFVKHHNLPDHYGGTDTPRHTNCNWPKNKIKEFYTYYHKWRLSYEPQEVLLKVPVEITERIIQCVELDPNWLLEELKRKYLGDELIWDGSKFGRKTSKEVRDLVAPLKRWKDERESNLHANQKNMWWFLFRNRDEGDFDDTFFYRQNSWDAWFN